MANGGPPTTRKWRASPVLRIALYYGVLVGGAALVWLILPEVVRARLAAGLGDIMTGRFGAADDIGQIVRGAPATFEEPASALTALMAMVGAFLLAMPVAWLYTLTRQKRGYRQSVVHTLVILPVVVAGVVVLVKHSLALAFSLAGIVAAVRFRNTLEDSKDAVYVFVATGIGLAAGVQLGVAVAISVTFNLVILYLWYTDFGRSPANLEGYDAARRLQRAMAIANRTGAFVARVDDEILKEMSPEQLDVLAERARRRRERSSEGMPAAPAATTEENVVERPGPTRVLRLRADDADAARRLMEETMGDQLKRVTLAAVEHEPEGSWRLEYTVTLRKSATTQGVIACVQSRGNGNIRDVVVAG